MKGLKRRLARFMKRHAKNKRVVVAVGVAALACLAVYTAASKDAEREPNPATYKPLLDLIAKAESRGNYNAYFGNAANRKVDFTSMTIADVMKWQSEYVRQGSMSSAVGKYQIMDTTLKGLVTELNVDTKERFDQRMQDKMAAKLLERRGVVAYVNGKITREEFARNLSKEWAALPRVTGKHPEKSYYDADGINKALVDVGDVLKAIEPIGPKK